MVSLLGLVGAAYLLIRFWPDLPMVIPKHFGFSGEVDGWGDRSSLFPAGGQPLSLYHDDCCEPISTHL